MRSTGSTRLQYFAALVAVWSAIVLAGGCQTAVLVPKSEDALAKLLTPVTTGPDSVTLEIFHARIPLDKQQTAESVWDRVDEQCFDAPLRGRLLANGFRAGVAGTPPPEGLASLLSLESEMPKQSAERLITGQLAAPMVTRRVLQLNRRNESSIQASELQDEATVLLSDDSGLHGTTYRQVQAAYSLKARAVEGQRVHIELSPELQSGELRNRISGNTDQGMFMVTPSRERTAFGDLALAVDLAPGDILLVGCLPDAPTSLGNVFHSCRAQGRLERKLILIRVLQTPPSEILAQQ